jgi:hypothetical protein
MAQDRTEAIRRFVEHRTEGLAYLAKEITFWREEREKFQKTNDIDKAKEAHYEIQRLKALGKLLDEEDRPVLESIENTIADLKNRPSRPGVKT